MANQTTTTDSQSNDNSSGYFNIVAWLLFGLIIILISRFKIGYTILVFFCLASILLVLAIGSPTIVTIFQNGAITQGKK